MTRREVSATDAARHLGDLLARVRYRGESFLIRRGREIVARLGPPPHEGLPGSDLARRWRERPQLSPEEGRAFARDLLEARKKINRPPRSRWGR
jgi:antitoxin (DNA-binding transcriptional repressor) of toxin-antitoxin stability system